MNLEDSEPEIVHVVRRRAFDERLLEDLMKATKRYMNAAAAEDLEEMEEKRNLISAIDIMERLIEYTQLQVDKLRQIAGLGIIEIERPIRLSEGD